MKKLFIVLFFVGCAGKTPLSLGVQNGRFSNCAKKSNCVSSQETEVDKKIDSLDYKEDFPVAFDRFIKIFNEMGAKIKKKSSHYIHAEFESRIFGFIDDVEVFFPLDAKRVEIKSASRVGYYDFGVNKSRVYTIIFKYRQFR